MIRENYQELAKLLTCLIRIIFHSTIVQNHHYYHSWSRMDKTLPNFWGKELLLDGDLSEAVPDKAR